MGQNGRRKRAGRPHEWSYSSGLVTDEKEVMNLDEVDQPEWVQAGHFQLSLDLRRQLAMREAGMSSEAKRKREKLREKRNQRKLRNQAKKKLDDEERERESGHQSFPAKQEQA